MAVARRFIVTKKSKSDEITYCEYEKRKGYNVHPKKDINFEDMINVNEMVIINPSLIKKLVNKKCTRNLEKILKMMNLIYDDDSDGTGAFLVLDEVERFRTILMNRYKEYLEKEEYDLYLKKLEILKSELEIRKQLIIENQEYGLNNGKAR